MTSIEYKQIMASRPFRIIVGADKKEFMIHADLLSNLSKPLGALVNNQMKESNTGVAEWPEVEEETFVRFCQFAYTGGYDEPIPEMLPKAKDEPREKVSGPSYDAKKAEDIFVTGPGYKIDDFFSDSLAYSKKTKKSRETTPPPRARNSDRTWSQFKSLSYAVPAKPNEDPKPPPVPLSEVLLSHARLYVLADYYDIQNLMTLSLQKLHRLLASADPGTSWADAVVKLVAYSYPNTADHGDELRTLLTKYIACKIELLWDKPGFRDLLAGYGELSAAVIGHMIPRLD
ncbi:hypothetical protein F4809DRAFT_240424 [Biscogniauxia mediterranea]|nr:hypothetical protein F4809DRAFT_240424 [Biscogniauxia mediterranea]